MPRKKAIKSLADSPPIQELMGILKENNKDTAGLTALLSYVKQMEDFVKSAEGRITDMQSQLTDMKEIQKHPIKTALTNTTESLDAGVAGIRAQLNRIKESIVEACKNAITTFKKVGITALDKLASFFNIKQGLEAIQKSTESGMNRCDKAVARVETFSKEYHATGKHLKNLLRMIVGKDPIDTEKGMGKPAKHLCATYKAEKNCLGRISDMAEKAIVGLNELGKNANEIRQERKKPAIDEHIASFEKKAEKINAEKSKVVDFKPKQQEELLA